jgi:hypothetical protein
VTAALPVLVIAPTARRIGVAAIDERLRLVLAETWYLRRHRTPEDRAGLVRSRLTRHLGLLAPAMLALAVAGPWPTATRADPLCSTLEGIAGECRIDLRPVVLAEACAALDWSAETSDLALRLIDQFPALHGRLGCLVGRNAHTDAMRNARPLFRAAATAYAIAAKHLILHG